MERILIFIKHHLHFLWRIIEWGNSLFFKLLFSSRLGKVLQNVMDDSVIPPYLYRKLEPQDAELLFDMIHAQDPVDLKYFQPHGFDRDTIVKLFRNKSFLMMGVFDQERLAGYFFLRFFANRKCFVGRLIDKEYRSKGIGAVMNAIMYETAWRMNFRCLSTISRNNAAVMKAHAKNRHMVVLKELQNNYLLVEFMRKPSE